ncbi:YhdP family protein [Lacisediminimonas profundi]|uniref:YhdP family protein n=1 Tax=Lacisediminimonas profundi TaxID=2603856 RepID=UPI00124BBF8A|nr:YhdP family protein [Lacisediminimonas profundi]
MPSTDQAEAVRRAGPGPVRAAGRAALHGIRSLNRATLRILAILFKSLVVGYFAFCVLFLALRYVVLPNIDQYKGTVEQVATRVVGRPVVIGTIHASWHGLNPKLVLNDVAIHNRTGEVALSLPRVSATISWWSVVVANLRLEALEILRPDLEIERDAEGSLFVGGIYIDPASKSDGSGLDWLLQQQQIVVRDGWVRWKDARRNAPELVLGQMTAVIENNWLQHRIAIKATPPPEVGAPLDLRARFSHSPFAQRISDPKGWTGTLYADWREADLARGATWIDYPVEIQQGRGAVRAWLSFDHAAVVDLTADLSLSGLSTRLRPDLDVLNLARVEGRVAAAETLGKRPDRLFSYGRRGHRFALQDFSFETSDGLRLPPTTIRERFVSASGTRPANTEVELASADLQALASFASRLPLSEEQRRLIADLAPEGRLTNFSAKWQGMYPDIKSYQVKGDFAALGIRPQPARPGRAKTSTTAAVPAVPAIPGIANMTGSVDLNEQGGNLRINAEKAALQVPGLFAEPELGFDELELAARWTLQEGNRLQFQVNNSRFLHEGMRGSLAGRYSTTLGSKQAGRGALELQGHLDQADMRRTSRYLPLKASPDVTHWLSGGLQDGKLNDVTLVLKGNLDDFPFRTTRPGEKPKGQFTVSGRIENGKLDYAPGQFAQGDRSRQMWPSIENINGRLLIDRTRLEVRADTARSHNVALSNVLAGIPDLIAASPLLSVTGTAQGPLQELLGFTVQSPVGGWIGHFTEQTRAAGSAKLLLNLQLPLHEMESSKVKGTLQFANNDVTLFDNMPPLSRTTGELRFSETGFELSGLRANFLGGPVALSGGSQREGLIAVRAEGAASVEELRRTYSTPVMQRLLQRVNGGSRYVLQVNVRDKRPDIILESSMQGIGLDFPSPLRKVPGEAMPLRFELTGLAPEASGAQRDEIKASLGTTINARYQRRKGTGNDATWEVVRAGIGVNVPAPQPDAGLVVNVNLRSLDIDAWRSSMAAIAGKADAAGAPAASAKAAADGLDLAQYFEPEVLAARATELTVGNKKLENVVVGASHQDGLWQANIESDQMSGYLSWAESRSGRGAGRVTARLASLIIPPSAAGDVSDLLEGKGAATRIPALDVVAENFELFNKKFGRLELNANNASTPTGREWRINKLSVINGDATMAATGSYQSRAGQSQSTLNYKLDIGDAGRLLDRLGFPSVLRGGKGTMTGDVSWNGLPFSIDIPSLSGQLNLDVAAGQFLKVDPGAAKLLGVLSLQALPRRLTLDFRDVFSEGFSFDGATAAANISQGVMKTDNFKMRSVNAAVLMNGTVDLARETQNMHVVVIPEINAGAASVAYGLMVNPVLGIGSFLAQLFLRDPLMRAFTMEYEITGPWKDPSIRKLARSNSAGTGSDSDSQGGSGNNGSTGAEPAPSNPKN